MQEHFLVLSILLAAAIIVAALVAARLFKSKKNFRNRNIDPTEIDTYHTAGVFTLPNSQPHLSNAAVNTLSLPEATMPSEQLGNEEPSISPSVIAPPPDVTIPTLIGDEIERKEKKTHTLNGNLERKAQDSVTEMIAISPSETGFDVLMQRDVVETAKETSEDKAHQENGGGLSSELRKPILTADRNYSLKHRTKEKGNFRGAPKGQRDKIPRELSKPKEISSKLKPELVCWRREGKWLIGIEIPKDYFSDDIQEVFQNSKKMLRNESKDQCWCLESLTDPLEVKWGNENNPNIDYVPINVESHAIFKLTGSEQAKGRQVKRISYGAYLLVVPSAWSYQKELEEQMEEYVSIEKCKAYFSRFEKEKEGQITFKDESGGLRKFEAKSSLFELVGTTLEDANDDMGPLFGNILPIVKIKSYRSWEEIACVVVIQQGVEIDEERFKGKIVPKTGDTELTLGNDLQAQHSGWYSLRFYDKKQDSPIETLDFRFVAALNKIKIHQNSVLPGRLGHKEVTINIFHRQDFSIKPAVPQNNLIQIHKESNCTTLSIPPRPEADESSWLLGVENSPYVYATFLAERIWWKINDETTEPIEWQDKSAVLKREDFKSSAHKALWIRLPKPGWVDRVYADFSVSNPRHFLIKADQRIKKISLYNFYVKAISNKSAACDLIIQVQEGHQRLSAIVGRLYAEKIYVESPIQKSLRTINERAACNGGTVFYGNCRHCRAILKKKNYESH